jgi:ribosomal protein L35
LNHLMAKKSSSRRRTLTAGDELYKGDRKRISRMLGQGA